MREILNAKDLCREFGYTQRALADKFGIPLRTFEQWCTGKRNCPPYVVGMMNTILNLEKNQT